MQKNQYILVGVVAVVAGAIGFLGGHTIGLNKNKNVVTRQGQFMQARGSGGGTGGARLFARAGSGFIGGEVLNVDEKSITVKSQDGGSKIVFLSASTTVGQFTSGSANDLAVGKNVMVNGTANSDGTITAQSIQIRPVAPPMMPSSTRMYAPQGN